MEALLAPIPTIHIEDGATVFAAHGRVAYGSDAWELFNRLEQAGRDRGLPVLLYASATESSRASGRFAVHKIVSIATLDGFEKSRGGKHVRPHLRTKRALEADGPFALFWEVVDFKPLEKAANLNSVRTIKTDGKKGNVLTSAPQGPVLVWTDDEDIINSFSK